MKSIFSQILAAILANSSAKDIAEIKASIAEMKADVALIKEAIFTDSPLPPGDESLKQLADAAEASAARVEGVATELDKLD